MNSWPNPPRYIKNEELERLSFSPADWSLEKPVVLSGLSVTEEQKRFKQLNYCGFRADRLYQARRNKKQYLLWIERYYQFRSYIVESNLALVYDCMGKSRFKDSLDKDEMKSDGMFALLRSVTLFDPWRKYKFSTYAFRAIHHAFSLLSLRHHRRKNHFAAFISSRKDDPVHKPQKVDRQSLYIERLSIILEEDSAGLTEIEKTILLKRFPHNGMRNNPRLTLQKIGKEFKRCREWVRMSERSGLEKLRAVLEKDPMFQGDLL